MLSYLHERQFDWLTNAYFYWPAGVTRVHSKLRVMNLFSTRLAGKLQGFMKLNFAITKARFCFCFSCMLSTILFQQFTDWHVAQFLWNCNYTNTNPLVSQFYYESCHLCPFLLLVSKEHKNNFNFQMCFWLFFDRCTLRQLLRICFCQTVRDSVMSKELFRVQFLWL